MVTTGLQNQSQIESKQSLLTLDDRIDIYTYFAECWGFLDKLFEILGIGKRVYGAPIYDNIEKLVAYSMGSPKYKMNLYEALKMLTSKQKKLPWDYETKQSAQLFEFLKKKCGLEIDGKTKLNGYIFTFEDRLEIHRDFGTCWTLIDDTCRLLALEEREGGSPIYDSIEKFICFAQTSANAKRDLFRVIDAVIEKRKNRETYFDQAGQFVLMRKFILKKLEEPTK
jgi:hypothetical protein